MGEMLTFSSSDDEDDDAALDADIDNLPGKPKMDAEQAEQYVADLIKVVTALHKSGLMITDAFAKGEVMMLAHNPNAHKLDKAVATAIIKHVLIHTKRGVQ